MEINEIMNLISSVGFPIFVAVWLLWKSDKTDKRTQEVMMELKRSIDKLFIRLSDGDHPLI